MTPESKKCPNCRLINPDSAQLCDCGYNFETESLTDEARRKPSTKAAIYNKSALMLSIIIIWAITYTTFQTNGNNPGQIGSFVAIAPILYVWSVIYKREGGKEATRLVISILTTFALIITGAVLMPIIFDS